MTENNYGSEPKNPWQTSGYDSQDNYDNAWEIEDAWQTEKNPYQVDNFTNPYQENPYQENFFDNAYTETFSNPDPQNERDSGWEL